MSRVLPILFNTEMVRAILDERKTVTRRVAKKIPVKTHRVDPAGDGTFICYWGGYMPDVRGFADGYTIVKPPYQPGNILYVRETWQCWRAHRYEANADLRFKAGGKGVRLEFPNGNTDFTDRSDYDKFVGKWFSHNGDWRPSIHMPKEAARIWLRCTDVRVERLQEITGEGILAEGIDNGKSNPAMGKRWENMQQIAFENLWDSTIKKSDLDRYGWDANPWVWVTKFERCGKPGN